MGNLSEALSSYIPTAEEANPVILETEPRVFWKCPRCGTDREPQCMLDREFGLSESDVKRLKSHVEEGNLFGLVLWLQDLQFHRLRPARDGYNRRSWDKIRRVSEFLREIAEHIDYFLRSAPRERRQVKRL